MDKIDTSGLESLPKTKLGEFQEAWPDIKKAIERKQSLLVIHENLQINGLDVSYVTFTRWVKRAEAAEAEAGSRPLGNRARVTPAPGEMAGASEEVAGDDKSDQILSTSGAALKEAQNVVKKDYAKIARQLDKDKK